MAESPATLGGRPVQPEKAATATTAQVSDGRIFMLGAGRWTGTAGVAGSIPYQTARIIGRRHGISGHFGTELCKTLGVRAVPFEFASADDCLIGIILDYNTNGAGLLCKAGRLGIFAKTVSIDPGLAPFSP